jgi:hypothetical protein
MRVLDLSKEPTLSWQNKLKNTSPVNPAERGMYEQI